MNDIKIHYVIDDRRAGDVPVVYSDPSKAERELGWRAEYGINEMVQDNWNWKKRILIGKGSAEWFSTSSMDAIVSIFSFLRIL